MSQEEMKKQAALKALDEVENGMKLGLGTGSTARYFVDGLGEKVRAGLEVVCVPTSEATHAQAESLNIPLADLGQLKNLDMVVDGADEIDPALNLVKGGGGALLREKIVAAASGRMVVIADETKWVKTLGAFPLPVEVNSFAHEASAAAVGEVLKATGHSPDLALRLDAGGNVFKTDSGHVIYDCRLREIQNPAGLAAALLDIPGVMEHGLFIGMAAKVYLACRDEIREIESTP
ncbi:MAG: ribose-5-phosphate isomerase RpiA [Parvibaculales bacterium]